MLPFSGLWAAGLASFIIGEVGNAGDPITSPGQFGAVAGDYAIWIGAGVPSSGWTLLSNAVTPIYGKALVSADLALSGKPNQGWGLSIYRDVTAAAVRAPSGFAKSAAHMGVVGIYASASTGAPSQVTSPPSAVPRLQRVNAPYFALFDVVAPSDPYPDGAPFGNGSSDYWTVLELLRS